MLALSLLVVVVHWAPAEARHSAGGQFSTLADCPAKPWPTTEFEVRDYRATPFIEWSNAARRAPEMWKALLDQFVDGIPFNESVVDTAWALVAERHLHDIATRLQAAGFECPRMRTSCAMESCGTSRI